MNHIDRVIEILRSPEISHIHFTAGQQVTPALFYKVAHAIELAKDGNGKGGIVVGLAPSNIIGAPAKYDDKTDTLLLGDPYNDLIYSPPAVQMRSLVVHEAVHAIADIQKLNLNRSTTEADAFLAQTIYILSSKHTNTVSNRRADYGDQQEANIYRKCNDIVTKYHLLAHSAVISHTDLKELKAIIHTQSEYSHQSFWDLITFDGVKGVSKR